MNVKCDRRFVVVSLSMLIILLFSACGGEVTPTAEEVVTIEPTIFVTTIVTQIVATSPPPTPTPIPTQTPWPTATLAWDPWAVHIYYPLYNCAGSRLHKGDMAFVGSLGMPIKISLTDQIFYDPGIRELEHGEAMQIINGPYCFEGTLVWRVYTVNDDIEGFVPEGDGEQYWLFPHAPTFPTPHKKQ